MGFDCCWARWREKEEKRYIDRIYTKIRDNYCNYVNFGPFLHCSLAVLITLDVGNFQDASASYNCIYGEHKCVHCTLEYWRFLVLSPLFICMKYVYTFQKLQTCTKRINCCCFTYSVILWNGAKRTSGNSTHKSVNLFVFILLLFFLSFHILIFTSVLYSHFKWKMKSF